MNSEDRRRSTAGLLPYAWTKQRLPRLSRSRLSAPRRSISRSRSSMKRWHSPRSVSRSSGGRVRFKTKKPSVRNWRTCSDVIRSAEIVMFATPVIVDDRIICGNTDRVFADIRDFLSFLAMIDDVGVRVGLDGRVVRHKVGDVRPRAHRHAELEVNLVVRGTASYLLGDRRYALTPGTLTWLFPGQDHVLVSESSDHELCWAVFRPALVAQIATTRQARPLLERDPVGEFSRRLEARRAGHLEALLPELHDIETIDDALHNAGLAYLLLSAWRAFLDSEDLVAG